MAGIPIQNVAKIFSGIKSREIWPELAAIVTVIEVGRLIAPVGKLTFTLYAAVPQSVEVLLSGPVMLEHIKLTGDEVSPANATDIFAGVVDVTDWVDVSVPMFTGKAVVWDNPLLSEESEAVTTTL